MVLRDREREREREEKLDKRAAVRDNFCCFHPLFLFFYFQPALLSFQLSVGFHLLLALVLGTMTRVLGRVGGTCCCTCSCTRPSLRTQTTSSANANANANAGPRLRLPTLRSRSKNGRLSKKQFSSYTTTINNNNNNHNATKARSTNVESFSTLKDRLVQMEKEVEAGRGASATKIVRELQEEGLLGAFSRAEGVPKRSYTLQDLRLNKIEPAALLSPTENYLEKVSTYCQRAYVAGLLSTYFVYHWDATQVFYLLAFSLMMLTVDKVGYNGGIEFLAVDTIGRWFNKSYGVRVSRHEAGHFLIAYIMGVLPRGYTLSAWNALKYNMTLSVQAGTSFCDEDFQNEVASGKLTSSTLDKFCCIALAGVAQEFIDHGSAEGGRNDILQLDNLLQGLGFTQKKADDQIRW